MKVWHNKLGLTFVGPIVFKPDSEGNPPSVMEVVNSLRKACKLEPM